MPAAAEEESHAYKNLQVLPQDISRDDLSEVMLANLRGLGLRRRGGEGCLHCHAGSMDTPRQSWDYASDEKPAKQLARVMMAMVRDINGSHLSQLASRSKPRVEVTCYSCHAGRINPKSLPDLLMAVYEGGDIDSLTDAYRLARSRYEGADAYDFRINTLFEVSTRLVDLGELDDAAKVLELNLEFHEGPLAHAGLIQLQALTALETSGIDAMVSQYHALKDEHPAEAFTPFTLDPLAWKLFRAGRQEVGLRLFELSFAEFPDEYISFENLAWSYELSGDHERGLEIAKRWLNAHPDHELGQRLLDELSRR
jgi:tetratricopeptide (TPR) repeat protein